MWLVHNKSGVTGEPRWKWCWSKSQQVISTVEKNVFSNITQIIIYVSYAFLMKDFHREWKGGESHLNTEGNNISKSREWLGRVQSTQGRINHSRQCIYVMELWCGPSYKALFEFWFCTEKKNEISLFQIRELHKSA